MEDGKRLTPNLTARFDSAQFTYESIAYSINFFNGKARDPFVLWQIHVWMTHTWISSKLHYALSLCLWGWRQDCWGKSSWESRLGNEITTAESAAHSKPR